MAGAVGAALAELFLDHGWVARTRHRRGLRVTPSGRAALREHWAVEPDILGLAS